MPMEKLDFIFLPVPSSAIFVINTIYGALLQGGMCGIILTMTVPAS